MDSNIVSVEDWEEPGIGVEITWFEAAMAAEAGVRRRIESMRADKKDAHGFQSPAPWENDIQSAAAELAFAKATGQYWDGSCNTFKRGDVGAWQVRWTAMPSGALIVRPGDADEDTFILVTGCIPHFRVIGGIKGSRAKQDRWLDAPGGRPPAYFVPQAWLRPLDSQKPL